MNAPDVEMKEASPVKKPEEPVEEKYDPFYEIKKSLIILDKAVKDKDVK